MGSTRKINEPHLNRRQWGEDLWEEELDDDEIMEESNNGKRNTNGN
ncbi:MAG: hypothetical protein QGH82_08010 [Candidatus Woesearchaeota archaeon]|jgi:hypothetical protein|nr:hypothetical protein [Candidatus Woesearchaeota archaeon]